MRTCSLTEFGPCISPANCAIEVRCIRGGCDGLRMRLDGSLVRRSASRGNIEMTFLHSPLPWADRIREVNCVRNSVDHLFENGEASVFEA
jgi:hypothetical protein